MHLLALAWRKQFEHIPKVLALVEAACGSELGHGPGTVGWGVTALPSEKVSYSLVFQKITKHWDTFHSALAFFFAGILTTFFPKLTLILGAQSKQFFLTAFQVHVKKWIQVEKALVGLHGPLGDQAALQPSVTSIISTSLWWEDAVVFSFLSCKGS